MSLVLRFAVLAFTFAPTIPAWGHASVLSHTHATPASAVVGFGELGVVAIFVMGALVLTLLQQVRGNKRSPNVFLYLRSKR